MGRLGIRIALASVSICTALVGCGPSQDEGNQTQTSEAPPAQPRSPEDVAKSGEPPDEAALFAILDQAENEVAAAPNNYRAEQMEDKWAAKWCSALKGVNSFKNWTGTVAIVDEGRFEVNLGGALSMADFDPSSALFRQVADLKEGQPVKLSGTLDHRYLTCAWTDVGSLVPYSVHLSSVSPM